MRLLVILLTLFLTNIYAAEDLGPRKELFRVDEVKVEGIRKVEIEAVLERIGTRKGMMLDNYLLRKDIEKIYSLKYFDAVEAHKVTKNGKNTLLFKLKEKPIIKKITFEGNSELDREDLLEVVTTKEFSILDINSAKKDVEALQKHYEEKGFFLANIKHEVRNISEENVELVFKVQEYDKVKVKKISFLGNKAFSDLDLQGIMETREEGLFSFMSDSGNFKEFNFQTDLERIKYFYKTKGYLQVNLGTPEITVSEDRKWVFITIKVNEGPMFTVNEVLFQGEVLFSDEQLSKDLLLKKGTTYSEELLRKDIQTLTEIYQDEGYAFANVLRTLHVVPGENKVDVEFSFEKGKIAYFGKITVKGNSKTRDKVVRRELRIKEGARFSGSDLRRSKENVNRLGFFEPGSVIFNTVSPKGKDDVLDVEISVKERNTGQISLGAGFSSATGFFIQSSIAQNNFMGYGQNLSFSLSWSDLQRTFNLGFTEPYLFDSLWTAGGDIYSTSNGLSEAISFRREGFNIRVGYPIFDYTRVFATYKLEDTQIAETDREIPGVIPEVENGIASSVRLSIVKDKRNNAFEPSAGYFASLSMEYAGLGGVKKWQKQEADLRYFYNVIGDLVFRSRLYAGNLSRINGQKIPRAEKFVLGGARNMRGYDFEDIGPKVGQTVDGRTTFYNVGALFSSFVTVEFEHPLAREAGLKWVVFADAGHAGDFNNLKLYKDYGFGFRWFSPIGVLRFEWGFPVEDKGSGGQFHFDIGQLF